MKKLAIGAVVLVLGVVGGAATYKAVTGECPCAAIMRCMDKGDAKPATNQVAKPAGVTANP